MNTYFWRKFLMSLSVSIFTIGCGNSNSTKSTPPPSMPEQQVTEQKQPPPANAEHTSPANHNQGDEKKESGDSSDGTNTPHEPELKNESPSRVKTEDGNINDLKKTLTGISEIAEPFLSQAARLKYAPVVIGSAISDEDCTNIEKKISANYPISPFKAIYDSGSSYFSICSDEEYNRPASELGWKLYFSDGVIKQNQFGIVGKNLLQKISINIWGNEETLTNLLLDENYRILEISSVTTYRNQKEPIFYSVSTVDSKGDYYSNSYYDASFKQAHAFETHQKYISADGKYSFQKNFNPRRSDKGSERVTSNFYKIANSYEWNSFSILITHAWFAGFYNYNGKITTDPDQYSTLGVSFVNGQEVCADGSANTKTSWTRYPSPTATYGNCMNDW